MTDLVDRLRNTGDDWPASLVKLEMEAAAEIERLRHEVRVWTNLAESERRAYDAKTDELELLRGTLRCPRCGASGDIIILCAGCQSPLTTGEPTK